MTDNKYNAVFGDMAQFIGMMPDCEFVDGTYGYKRRGDKFYYCERHNEKYGWSVSQKVSIDFRPIAMRELVSPKPTWTKADQEKGILPTVGCELRIGSDFYIVEAINFNEGQLCIRDESDGELSITYIQHIQPIETPREKYDRERDECIDKLLAKIPPSPITVVPAMKIVYEELRPFTGGDHD